MRRYLKIYLIMIKANLAVLATYRVAFINSFLIGIIWGMFLLISAVVITSQVPSIGGWSRLDLILLSAMYNVVIGFFYTMISPNFYNVPEIIQYGRLDLYLVRPMDAQFLLLWRTINLGGLGRLIFGGLAVVIILLENHVGIAPLGVLVSALCTVLACLFLYGIWASAICLLFWQKRLNNLIDLLYTTTGFGRYPRETLASAPIFLSFVAMPFFLTVSTPTHALMGLISLPDILILTLAALASLIVSRLSWKIGLRAYTGASG